jgi:hypothetical protein
MPTTIVTKAPLDSVSGSASVSLESKIQAAKDTPKMASQVA